ncbi:MAG: succinate--CoA ligase subunit alpha [Candidatus Xiphinematobacter sp.]|nr:MAG: succinate--CoA ligase subunit alpha [Candidatus Xiphinematobacter sp.]
MAVLINKSTRLLVQGITGRSGSFHTRSCIEYGTNVVAGVTPGRGGGTFDSIVPIFDTVEEARKETGCDATMIFVPGPFAADAVLEAAAAGVGLIVCITEGIPTMDMVRVMAVLQEKECRLIGPNCPGVITPGQCKIGIMPGYIHRPGSIGIISRSGTLTYEAVWQLTERGYGQSTCIGVGGDPVQGTSHLEALKMLHDDPETQGIVLVGEIGGTAEEQAAAWAKEHGRKPLAAFVAGATAPAGRRMGHAGAIISSGKGTAQSKIEALEEAGFHIARSPADIAKTVIQALEAK